MTDRAVSGFTLPQRAYGETEDRLSVIGFGGILVMGEEQSEADRLVAEAFDKGVNYFDVAPTYGDAEQRLGPALEPYRDRVFLACKTHERSREGAQANFDASLDHLRTDHLDLYQLHGLVHVEKDVDAAFAKGGAMEVLIAAKKAGQVRCLGFSAHTEEAALAAMDRYDFDSILFPINFACYYASGFGKKTIEQAQRKGLAILALKAMARQHWAENDPKRSQYPKSWYEPNSDPELNGLAVRWTLNQPVTAAVSPGAADLFWRMIDIAADLQPLSAEEEQQLRQAAAAARPIFPQPAED